MTQLVEIFDIDWIATYEIAVSSILAFLVLLVMNSKSFKKLEAKVRIYVKVEVNFFRIFVIRSRKLVSSRYIVL